MQVAQRFTKLPGQAMNHAMLRKAIEQAWAGPAARAKNAGSSTAKGRKQIGW